MIDLNTPHDKLLSWFQLEFPELVQSMKDCSHHYDDKNLNPYHLEGSVLTHSLMVYKQGEQLSPENLYTKFSTLLHDVGKPRAAELVHERSRKRFIGHEGVSAFVAVDILNKTDLTVDQKIHIFKIIAYHGKLLNHIKSDKTIKSDVVKVFRGARTLLADLTHQVRADSTGRFYVTTAEAAKADAGFTKHLPTAFAGIVEQLDDGVPAGDLSAPTLTVLVGPPCSRKTSMVNDIVDTNTVVISRDVLVQAAGEKRGMDYAQAWNFLRHNPQVSKTEVDEVLNARYSEARAAKKPVVIDMTNMSKTGRRKWVNEFAGYRKQCVVFVSGYEALLECNAKRGATTGKKISEQVVLDMCKRFSLPMYSEGFTEIDYVWND